MASGGKFGTLGGVYTPSILTILGVIMYMRLGWIVGNADSLLTVIIIILMAHIVSVSTGLSVSSVATDKKIKAGGIYYMLSRSLGFPIGGAIGVTIFVATALSIALYLIGFGESALPVLGMDVTINNLRIIGTAALALIVTIAYISTSIAIKSQYIILGLIILSLISVFMGTSDGKGFDFSSIAEGVGGADFSVLFGIFFPAVTGFTAGVAMSGDLKDPKKSIPWGTMLAIGTGLLVYITLAIFINYNIPVAELQNNNNALVEFGYYGVYFVTAGIWGATLSSALGGILGAPRILQAMSIDKITPRFFARGVGEDNEPRRALMLTFVLAELGILIGELDVIAEIVAMFYMAAYLFINLSCFLEQWASPDFRPTFRISIFVPLVGTIATFLLMIQLNLVAALVSVLIMGIIFLWLTRKQLELGSGDVWQSVWSSVVKLGLKNLNKKTTHNRNWEPNILLFSGGTKARPHLLEFSKSIAGRNGMISNFDLIENKTAKLLFPKHKQSVALDDIHDDSIFHRKQECKDIYTGIEVIAETYGFSGIEPNTVLMGWARNTKDPTRFTALTNSLHQLDYNVLFLDYDAEKGFGNKQKIDIWWNDISQLSYLTVQLTKLLMTSSDWSNASVRFFFLNNDNGLQYSIKKAIEKRTEELRNQVSIEVINNEIEQKNFYEIVKTYSFESDLIIIDLPELDETNEAHFVASTNDLLAILGTTLIVKGSSHFHDGLGVNSKIEKEFNTISNNHLEVKLEEELPALGNVAFHEASPIVEHLDQQLLVSNENFVNAVYNPLNKVYEVFSSVLSDDNMETAAVLEQIEQLLIDIQDNRLSAVGEGIALGIKNQIKNIKGAIDELPFQVVREFTPDELLIKSSDSAKLAKQKKRLTRWTKQPKSKVKIQAIAQHHYENGYLVEFKAKLNTIGLASFQLNVVIKKWLLEWAELKDETEKRAAIKELGEALHQHILRYKQRTYNVLNRLSRKYSNTILLDANKLEIKDLVILREEERSASALKAIYESISNYPSTWKNNSGYLLNQLSVNVSLLKLKDTIIPHVNALNTEIQEKEINPIIAIAETVMDDADSLEVDNLIDLENKLLELGIDFNVEHFVQGLTEEIEQKIKAFCRDVEVIPLKALNEFEQRQDDIAPDQINVRRVTDYLIENEIINEVNSLLHLIANEVKSESLKMENSIRLLQFSITNQEEDAILLKKVKDKVQLELSESVTHLGTVSERLAVEIKHIITHLKTILVDDIVLGRAENLNGIIRREKAKKGYKKYTRRASYLIDKTNNKVDKLIIKGKDLLAISSHQYRTKALQNPHSKIGAFVDKISISKTINQKLPFYYQQLFTGKHNAPTTPLSNRMSEISQFSNAYEKYQFGKKGAILFTGEHHSGMSYLIENILNINSFEKVLKIEKPSMNFGDAERLIERAFKNASGQNLSIDELMNQLPNNAVVVIEDIELWWTRTEKGTLSLSHFNSLIQKYRHKVLFLLSCNTHSYQLLRKVVDLDTNLLETITLSPLKIHDIRIAILSRHRSGGLQYEWKGKHEKELGKRRENQIIKRIAAVSEGNIGACFYTWLGNIEDVQNNTLVYHTIDQQELPNMLTIEQDNILLQILLHKELSMKRLEKIYKFENKEQLFNNVESLYRMGLINEIGVKNYQINPFVTLKIVRHLRRKELIN
ncbi:MAG: amino acid permease [Flavobacteriales bacterium]|jgi:amino acid transporter|nr:amino acid permease [Flavobacteriales bacterium]